jgi:hypothetical protein
MTGFLNNQVARSLGAPPVVRPRLPSLFEPPDGVAPLPAAPGEPDVDWALEPQDGELPQAPAARSRSRSAEPGHPVPGRMPDLADDPESIVEPRAIAPARSPLVRPARAPELPSPAVFGEAAPVAEPPPMPGKTSSEVRVAPALPGEPPAPPATIQRIVERVLVAGGEPAGPARSIDQPPAIRPIQPQLAPPEPSPAPGRGPLDMAVPAERGFAAPHQSDDDIKVGSRERLVAPEPAAWQPHARQPRADQRSEAQAQPAQPAPSVPRSAVVVQTQMIRYAEAPRPAPEAAPPAPTIQVTIGRVEVRATPQARPTAAARQAPAATGLDDYLRQRSRGGGG